MQKLRQEHAADTDCAVSFGVWIDDYERVNKCLALERGRSRPCRPLLFARATPVLTSSKERQI